MKRLYYSNKTPHRAAAVRGLKALGGAMRTAVLAAAVSLSLVGLGSARAATAAAVRVDTNIPPQNLSSALKQFAQFRDMQVLYFSASVKELKSNGATGDLTASETLDRILSGTGLTYRYVDENAVTLLPASAKALHAPPPRSGIDEKEGKSGSSGRFRLAQESGAAGEGPASVAAAPVGPLQGPSQLQTVVVTAQKRSQNAQSVPISLSVLTGADIQEQGIRDVSDIAQFAPGIAVQRTGPGENTVVMRGVASSAGVSSTTGVYYGEVPVSLLRQVDMPLFDLARVEVLRGPQGTLYGSGSMGGTIKYVPNVPEFNRFTTTVGLGVEHIDKSSGLGHKTYGVVNIPLVDDKLAARIMVFSQYDKGYIDRYDVSQTNPVTGIDTTIPPSHGVNSADWYGYQIQLKYKPWDNVTILPMFLSQKNEAASLFVIDLPQSDLAAGQLLQARDANSPHSNDANIANLTIDATFGAVDLVSTTSYLSLTSNENEDSAATQHVLMGIDGPVVAFPVWTWSKPSELIEELRASAKLGAFEGTLGVYYNHTRTHSGQNIPFPQQWVADYTALYGSVQAALGNPDYDIHGTMYYGTDVSESTERSVFGQGTYHITDKLSATVGVRAAYFDVSGSGFAWGWANGPETTHDNGGTFHGISPKYNLTYDVTPNVMVYSTVAKGFRSGSSESPAPVAVCGEQLRDELGIQSSPTVYNPDSLWSYEVGAKTQTFDRRMTLNGAAYYIDWSNLQEEVALRCGFPFTGNYGKARVEGAEAELTLLPIDRLLLHSSASYTEATLRSTTPGTSGVAGDPLPDVPKWTASVSAEYRQEIFENLNGFVRLEGSYQGMEFRNFPLSNGAYDPFREVPAYTFFNLRFGARQAASKWEVTAYVTNLTNKLAQSGLRGSDTGADLDGTRPVAIVQPRTFGVETTWRFD